MPSDQEKLAIAEEKVRIAKEMVDYKSSAFRDSFTCILPDVTLRWTHDATAKTKLYFGQRTTNHGSHISGGGPDLSSSECPIEAVYLARQKLAAEKEAARTPEERRLIAELDRLKKVLDDIATYGGYSRTGSCCADVARKALQGA